MKPPVPEWDIVKMDFNFAQWDMGNTDQKKTSILHSEITGEWDTVKYVFSFDMPGQQGKN